MSTDEWPLDSDGFPHREAGRCIVFNPRGEILLILGHDIDDPNYRWWFTPGGGTERGETQREAASRELGEETGLVVDPHRLVGPVLDRRSSFHFLRKTRKQDELFYLVTIDADEQARIDSRAHVMLTDQEKTLLVDMRWWDLDELAALARTGHYVFPDGLADMARGWLEGWDGELIIRIEE
ncbi:MAG: NUDIX domain-containing protein [Trueperella sp.]|nr:NUDIX domain-containing protein [Trueperella sp.]